MKLRETIANTFTAPGFGVYTVHAGSQKKKRLASLLYPSAQSDFDILNAWKDSLERIDQHQGPFIYGISSDTGGGIQRGANWGPLVLREFLYSHFPSEDWSHILDLGDVRVNAHLLLDEYLSPELLSSCKKSMYGNEHSTYSVSPLSIAGDMLKLFHHQHPGKKLFMIGGDHSVSFPAIREFVRHQRILGKNPAVIQFDAHTDLLDERMGVPVCFGSWTSHVLPELSDPSQLIQIGIRASGKDQSHWEKTKGVTQFWAKEVHSRGPESIAQSILTQLKSRNTDGLYITFDIDALDSSEALATGTPEPGGLKTRDCIEIIETLARGLPLLGADLTELAPFVRHPDLSSANQEPDPTISNSAKIAHSLLKNLA